MNTISPISYTAYHTYNTRKNHITFNANPIKNAPAKPVMLSLAAIASYFGINLSKTEKIYEDKELVNQLEELLRFGEDKKMYKEYVWQYEAEKYAKENEDKVKDVIKDCYYIFKKEDGYLIQEKNNDATTITRRYDFKGVLVGEEKEKFDYTPGSRILDKVLLQYSKHKMNPDGTYTRKVNIIGDKGLMKELKSSGNKTSFFETLDKDGNILKIH